MPAEETVAVEAPPPEEPVETVPEEEPGEPEAPLAAEEAVPPGEGETAEAAAAPAAEEETPAPAGEEAPKEEFGLKVVRFIHPPVEERPATGAPPTT